MGMPVLPEAPRAVVDERKLTDYLLKQDHPGNGGKAAFFRSLGYSHADAADLREALLLVAALGRVVRRMDSVYGQKSVVDGWLRPKTGGSPQPVRTVWMVASGGDAPRFVTAYPLRG